MICGSGGSKSRFAKAAGAPPSGQMREKISRRCGAKHVKSKVHFWKLRCRTFGRRCGAKHISKSKCTKHTRVGALLEVVEKVYAVVARSTFPSQNVQNTPGSEHVWKLRCRKKWSPLWREAHFQLKMYKTPQSENFWKLTCRKKCTPLRREAHVQVKMCK